MRFGPLLYGGDHSAVPVDDDVAVQQRSSNDLLEQRLHSRGTHLGGGFSGLLAAVADVGPPAGRRAVGSRNPVKSGLDGNGQADVGKCLVGGELGTRGLQIDVRRVAGQLQLVERPEHRLVRWIRKRNGETRAGQREGEDRRVA
jgi:hypothetical protein